MLATLNLQKTVGRNQIHRIHGFPHLGTVPKTRVSNGLPSYGPRPCPCPASATSCTGPLAPHLAPHQGPRVNSINKQQMEKYISQENKGGGSELRAPHPRLLPRPSPLLSSPSVLAFPLFGSAAPCGPWAPALCPHSLRRGGQPSAHVGPHLPLAATCAHGPPPWRPPRWWPCAPQVPGQPRHSRQSLWAPSRWCCPRAIPGPRSAGWGPGRAG